MSVDEKIIGIDESGMKLLSILKMINNFDYKNSFQSSLNEVPIKFKPFSFVESTFNRTFEPTEYDALVLGYTELINGNLEKINPRIGLYKRFSSEAFPPTLCACIETAEVAKKLFKQGKLNHFDAIGLIPNNSVRVTTKDRKSIRDFLAYGSKPLHKNLYEVIIKQPSGHPAGGVSIYRY